MHTTTCGETTFSHHGDYSGPVTIRVQNGASLDVPGGDLIAFVAEYVRAVKIAELESARALEILGVIGTDR